MLDKCGVVEMLIRRRHIDTVYSIEDPSPVKLAADLVPGQLRTAGKSEIVIDHSFAAAHMCHGYVIGRARLILQLVMMKNSVILYADMGHGIGEVASRAYPNMAFNKRRRRVCADPDNSARRERYRLVLGSAN